MRGFFVRINATAGPNESTGAGLERHLTLLDEEWARIAALGVDTDCKTCAGAGIDRLAEAAPDIDWGRVVHEVVHNEEKDPGFINGHYWCEHCEEE